MAKTLQFRRDTTANLASVTGAVGEIFIDTTKDTVVVMDGATAGGFPLQGELTAGSGIDITAGTISATGGGGSSNSFANIAVSGQTTVVADSSTDTLTLAAGSGISITTDAGADTITIAAIDSGVAAFNIVSVNASTYTRTVDFTGFFIGQSGDNPATTLQVDSGEWTVPSIVTGTIRNWPVGTAFSVVISGTTYTGVSTELWTFIGGDNPSFRLSNVSWQGSAPNASSGWLNATSLTFGGTFTTTSIKTDNYYYANGAAVSFGGGSSYGDANVGTYLTTYTGNIGNVSTTANVVTTQYFIGNGSQLTGITSGGGGGFPTTVNSRIEMGTLQNLTADFTATPLTITVTPSSTSAPVFVTFNFQAQGLDTDSGMLLQLYQNGSAVVNSELQHFLIDNGAATYAGFPTTYTFAYIPGTATATTLTLYARKTGGNTSQIGSGLGNYCQASAIVW